MDVVHENRKSGTADPVADSDLVARCRADDRCAFDEIVARFKDRILNYALRMIGSREDAEDLAQETFVRAFVGLRSFRSRASLNTWIFRIATNLCIDYRRRRTTDRVAACIQSLSGNRPDEGAPEIPDWRYEPSNAVMASELGAVLRQAIGELPHKLRAVVVLHDMEGLSYEEVAGIVRCPLGTVKSRLFHARMALRAKVGPYLSGSAEQK